MLTPRQTLATFLRVAIMHAPGAVQKITADDLRGALIDLLLDCDAAAGVSNSDSAQPSADIPSIIKLLKQAADMLKDVEDNSVEVWAMLNGIIAILQYPAKQTREEGE